MAKGFFVRMAAGNLARSRRMYVPYFISSTVMIAVYFLVVTIMNMRSLENIDYSESVTILFRVGMVVMTILIFPFMLYINSFLIKRRKKEFGLYGILGLEKRHVGRVILWENTILSFSSLALGILVGCVFGKLIFLLLLFALRSVASGSLFTIPWQAFAYTAALFTVIFAVTTLFNLLHVHLANPIDLLKGGQKGEKKVRLVIPMTIVGLVLMAWAYYTSATVTNALTALTQFMLAVIAVIIATYLLFTTGSVLLINLLRKNKAFYYKSRNFVAVSGMMHRMKQNASGLASICILSTMVLVTVSTCCALFLGQEDILRILNPDDVAIYLKQENTQEDADAINDAIDATAAECSVQIVNRYSYSYQRQILLFRDGKFIMPDENDLNLDSIYNELFDISYITLQDYNENCADNETLAADEVLVLSNDKVGDMETIQAGDTAYRVKRIVRDTKFTTGRNSVYTAFLVSPDETAARKLRMEMNPGVADEALYPVIVFDLEGTEDDGLHFSQTLRSRIGGLKSLLRVDDIFRSRIDSYGIYGGLLFLGIFFAVLFLTATVLIIYFKQVSEGYDDKERFEILQKVGMDDVEVKRTINKQILIVFFLPLVSAFVHLFAASNMIIRMLEAFNLFNRTLSAICLTGTSVAFGLAYAFVYKVTARTYYRIVRR